jgi:hypothetical protein
LSNRKNIQAGKLEITIQQLKTKALYKKYGPQVSAKYEFSYNPILQSSIILVGVFNPDLSAGATNRIQFGTTWAQTAGIKVSQSLFDASIKKNINKSRLQEKIRSSAQAQTEYELACEVAKTYLTIWLQEEQRKAAILDTVRTGISYQLPQEKYNAGRLLKFELNQSTINHNNTKQRSIDAAIIIVETKILMHYLIGMLERELTDFITDTSLFYANLSLDHNKITSDSIPITKQLNLQKETVHVLQYRFKEQQITGSELNRQENELQKLKVDCQNTKANAWLFEIAYLNVTG